MGHHNWTLSLSGQVLRRLNDLSDPFAARCMLQPMTALADPFSRVHPLFWPVLWVSLRAFVAWTGKLIEDGHGYAGMRVEITWYGWIHVVYLDLSPERARFNRHMAGETDWRDVLAEAGWAVESLLAVEVDPNTLASSHVISVLQSSPARGGGLGGGGSGNRQPRHSRHRRSPPPGALRRPPPQGGR